MAIDWRLSKETIDKVTNSNEQKILHIMNQFCATVDVLDVIVIPQFGTTSMNGTFSKAMGTYSKMSEYLVVYQVPKSGINNGVEG